MSGSETEARSKGGKYVVGTGSFRFGGDVNGGSGGGTDGGGDRRDGDGDGDRDRYRRIIKW